MRNEEKAILFQNSMFLIESKKFCKNMVYHSISSTFVDKIYFRIKSRMNLFYNIPSYSENTVKTLYKPASSAHLFLFRFTKNNQQMQRNPLLSHKIEILFQITKD